MKESDPELGTHGGLKLRLETSTGEFYALQRDGKLLQDRTLTGLKSKIDERQRLAARAQMGGGIVVCEISDPSWDDDEPQAELRKASFLGMNAISGEIKIELPNKQKQSVYRGVTILRVGEPALPAIEKAAAAWVEAARLKRRTKKALDALLAKHGFRVRSLPARDKKAAAREEEQRLADFLGGKAAANAEAEE